MSLSVSTALPFPNHPMNVLTCSHANTLPCLRCLTTNETANGVTQQVRHAGSAVNAELRQRLPGRIVNNHLDVPLGAALCAGLLAHPRHLGGLAQRVLLLTHCRAPLTRFNSFASAHISSAAVECGSISTTPIPRPAARSNAARRLIAVRTTLRPAPSSASRASAGPRSAFGATMLRTIVPSLAGSQADTDPTSNTAGRTGTSRRAPAVRAGASPRGGKSMMTTCAPCASANAPTIAASGERAVGALVIRSDASDLSRSDAHRDADA